MRTTIQNLAITLTTFLTLSIMAGPAAADYIYTKRNNLAVDGYDPVAYFTLGEATKGAAEHELEWNGAVWRFANAENKAAFESEPERYAPQYGGWCAWAAAGDYLARGDARHWKIVDDKLYLNYNAGIKRKWEKDVPGNIEKADVNWPDLKAEAAEK